MFPPGPFAKRPNGSPRAHVSLPALRAFLSADTPFQYVYRMPGSKRTPGFRLYALPFGCDRCGALLILAGLAAVNQAGFPCDLSKSCYIVVFLP